MLVLDTWREFKCVKFLVLLRNTVGCSNTIFHAVQHAPLSADSQHPAMVAISLMVASSEQNETRSMIRAHG